MIVNLGSAYADGVCHFTFMLVLPCFFIFLDCSYPFAIYICED